MRTLFVITTAALLVGSASGGIYSTIDREEELQRFSPDFERWRHVLLDWQIIGVPEPKRTTPIRQRYVLIETLGTRGALSLKLPEQKLDYSAVLIRRGRADEAAEILTKLGEELPDNFIVQSQLAFARFLGSPDRRATALDDMKQALEIWPLDYSKVGDEQKKFLHALNIEQTAFDRYRRYEVLLERLMRSRLAEERRKRKKEVLKECVDPIFGDDQGPITFLNEKGEFTVGRIPPAQWARLPKDADVAVQQLLIWMPMDDRLLWLLGEVLNAKAMEYEKEPGKKLAMIESAGLVFKKMHDDAFFRPTLYGKNQAEERLKAINKYREGRPAEDDAPDDLKKLMNKPDDGDDSLLSNEQFWRTLIVAFITGLAVGVFSLWQLQELRRRRQASTGPS